MSTKHVADIIDDFSWMAYRLATTTGSNFSVWVQWNTDTAAWRKGALIGGEQHEAAHQSLAKLCEDALPLEGPRYKLGGFLAWIEEPEMVWDTTPCLVQTLAAGHRV